MSIEIERALHEAMDEAVSTLRVAPDLAATVRRRAKRHRYGMTAASAALVLAVSLVVPLALLPRISEFEQDRITPTKQPLMPSALGGAHPLVAGLSCFSISTRVHQVDVNAPITNGGEAPLTVTAIVGQSPGLRLTSVTRQKSCTAFDKGTPFHGARLAPGGSTVPLSFRFLAVNCAFARSSLSVLVRFQSGQRSYSQILELPHGTDQASNHARGGGACAATHSP